MSTWIIEHFRPPCGKGRHRTTRAGIRYTPKETKQWERSFEQAAAEVLPHDRQLEGPLRVDILAALLRPGYMRKQYKRTGEYKYPTGLVWCTSKPDSDNIRKIVLDGLKSFIGDDSKVVDGRTIKAYCEIDGIPRTVVRITDDIGTAEDCAVLIELKS